MALIRKSGLKPQRLWKGAMAGMIGGLAASWAMNRFQSAWSTSAQLMESGTARGPQEGSAARQEREEPAEDATMKAAGRLAKSAGGRELSRQQKEAAGSMLHYAFGTLSGALYGAMAEAVPSAKAGQGMAFGAALFVVADELAVPALGLSGSPQESPLGSHVYGLASHLVYGAVLEAVRSPVRLVLTFL